jgi:imidazolonepropionase-like amidohydrolase
MGMIAAKNAKTALDCGVTSIIGSSNPALLDVSLKEAILLGIVEGPRVVACTREFMASGDQADGTNRSWFMGLGESGLTRRVDGVEQMVQAVREELGRGCDIVKLSASPGHGSHPAGEATYYSLEEIEAAAYTAHERGKRVRAHTASRESIIRCARAGVDIIDHADLIDEEGMELVLVNDLSITPSMLWTVRYLEFAASWNYEMGPFPIGDGFPETRAAVDERLDGVRREFEYTCEMVPKLEDAGVRLLVGDDFGFPMMPHGDYVSELEVYVGQLGIEPLSVLRWATKHGAEAMGRGDELGTIAPGKLADLVVVDGDPSVEIGCLREGIVAVMKDGLFHREPPAPSGGK